MQKMIYYWMIKNFINLWMCRRRRRNKSSQWKKQRMISQIEIDFKIQSSSPEITFQNLDKQMIQLQKLQTKVYLSKCLLIKER